MVGLLNVKIIIKIVKGSFFWTFYKVMIFYNILIQFDRMMLEEENDGQELRSLQSQRRIVGYGTEMGGSVPDDIFATSNK